MRDRQQQAGIDRREITGQGIDDGRRRQPFGHAKAEPVSKPVDRSLSYGGGKGTSL